MRKLSSVLILLLLLTSVASAGWWTAGWRSAGLPSIQAYEGVEDDETLQTNPKIRSTTIQATVPDIVPPSTPLLYSPTDGTLSRVNRLVFMWYGSTDNVAVTGYELWLDGTLLQDDIPLTDSTHSRYTLTYDALTNLYSLDWLSPILDGEHTWKIQAVDARDNKAASATWSFLIDTVAPTFVVSIVDDQSFSISVQDIATVPDSPIEITHNEPILSGTGEPNSQVDLLITSSLFTAHVYFQIDADGNWSAQLPTLPRDNNIDLFFTITDRVGNISVLEGVKLLLRTPQIIIPLGPLAPLLPDSPLFPQPTPAPGSVGPAQPVIVLTLPQPREAVLDLTRRLLEPFAPTLQRVLDLLPSSIRQLHLTGLSSIIVLLLWLGSVLVGIMILGRPFGSNFSLQSVKEIFWALGWWPVRHFSSIALDSRTGKGVGFSRALISGTTRSGHQINLTLVADTKGRFRSLRLPEGSYRATVLANRYSFPSTFPISQDSAGRATWYTGEEWRVESSTATAALWVPVDETRPPNWLDGFRDTSLKMIGLHGHSGSSWLAGLIILTILFPSLVNGTTLAICLLRWLTLRYPPFRKKITFTHESAPLAWVTAAHWTDQQVDYLDQSSVQSVLTPPEFKTGYWQLGHPQSSLQQFTSLESQMKL